MMPFPVPSIPPVTDLFRYLQDSRTLFEETIMNCCKTQFSLLFCLSTTLLLLLTTVVVEAEDAVDSKVAVEKLIKELMEKQICRLFRTKGLAMIKSQPQLMEVSIKNVSENVDNYKAKIKTGPGVCFYFEAPHVDSGERQLQDLQTYACENLLPIEVIKEGQ
ncbi:unnamed protein product [Echinostoma caproni]|uniref:Secreted protein n=1 Tax=Echinostoma caproni TaxID=27848 RepID=A0A183ABH0_9TREM|nr:unnamed protein product [Echinostoma caproni]